MHLTPTERRGRTNQQSRHLFCRKLGLCGFLIIHDFTVEVSNKGVAWSCQLQDGNAAPLCENCSVL